MTHDLEQYNAGRETTKDIRASGGSPLTCCFPLASNSLCYLDPGTLKRDFRVF